MAFKKIDQDWCETGDFRCEYILDTEADVASLPNACCVGSVAVVVESGNVYMVNASGKWAKFGG